MEYSSVSVWSQLGFGTSMKKKTMFTWNIWRFFSLHLPPCISTPQMTENYMKLSSSVHIWIWIWTPDDNNDGHDDVFFRTEHCSSEACGFGKRFYQSTEGNQLFNFIWFDREFMLACTDVFLSILRLWIRARKLRWAFHFLKVVLVVIMSTLYWSSVVLHMLHIWFSTSLIYKFLFHSVLLFSRTDFWHIDMKH